MHSEEIRQKVHHYHERGQVVKKILSLGRLVEPAERLTIAKDDPDDDKFIEAAVAGNAAYIISQDKHLLMIGEFRGIKIVTPEDLLKELE